ncbi:hypothetical protein ACHAXT_000432 [Thalassiosira profunda]
MRREASAATLAAAAAVALDEAAAYVLPINRLESSLRRPHARRQTQPLRDSPTSHPRAMHQPHRNAPTSRPRALHWPLFSDPIDDDDDVNYDPNKWISSEEQSALGDASWEESLARREDGSLWSSFASSDDDASEIVEDQVDTTQDTDGGEEAWLDALASIAADEVEFMSKEADRADKVRQMQELGFGADSISSTLGVATDDDLETDETNDVFELFKEETAKTGFGLMVDDDIDMNTVESHSQVEWDDETDEPVRAQHVYVDEVTCIGCTNCAMIAQSTFFMEGEHGRARVFQQWGDDEETIEVAIQTCPVDCIHYVPYDELKRLEIERRDQNINFKARLVNQGEYTAGAGTGAKYGGGKLFTEQQVISGNMGSRCNNCPTRGCKNCPMFGVGLNPEFQKKEKRRKEKLAKAEMRKKMESQNKRAEL